MASLPALSPLAILANTAFNPFGSLAPPPSQPSQVQSVAGSHFPRQPQVKISIWEWQDEGNQFKWKAFPDNLGRIIQRIFDLQSLNQEVQVQGQTGKVFFEKRNSRFEKKGKIEFSYSAIQICLDTALIQYKKLIIPPFSKNI